MSDISPSTSNVPNESGRFGLFGGRYVPETLTKALNELTAAYIEAKQDPVFQNQLTELFNDFVGRPSPLYFAERLTAHCGGAEIWLKREDTNHTGAHKINNTLGQALLTMRMGKKRVIAEKSERKAKMSKKQSVLQMTNSTDMKLADRKESEEFGTSANSLDFNCQTANDEENAALEKS